MLKFQGKVALVTGSGTGIGQAIAKKFIENGDYYSRYFAHTPRMITNRGCLDVKNSNIDTIQIIQKG